VQPVSPICPDRPSHAASAVGAEADNARIEQLLSELSGKDLNDILAAGSKKLASVPSGGGGAAPAAAAAGGAAAPKAEEKKKEEEKEEPEEARGRRLRPSP